MDRAMRLVIGTTALVAGILLQAASAFAQQPPWAQQQRRIYAPQQQRAIRPAPQLAPQARQPQAQQQQQQQQQQKPRPEPAPQNTQERLACLNKDTPPAALISACTVVIEAGRDKPAALASMHFNRGEAYREKGELDAAIKDLGESINLDGKNANVYFSRGTALKSKGQVDAAIADFDQAIKLDSRNPAFYSSRSHALYEKRDYERAIAI